jgi:hypothetical protein
MSWLVGKQDARWACIVQKVSLFSILCSPRGVQHKGTQEEAGECPTVFEVAEGPAIDCHVVCRACCLVSSPIFHRCMLCRFDVIAFDTWKLAGHASHQTAGSWTRLMCWPALSYLVAPSTLSG